MKHLVFTVTTDLNYDQRMQRICETLALAGYHVTLIGRLKQGSALLRKASYAQVRLYCFFQKGKWFYVEYNIRLFFYLLFFRCSAICGVDLDTALPAKLNARIKGIPFVYDAHEYFTEIPELVDRPGVRRIWRAIERYVVKPGLPAYTVSQSLADVFFQVYKVPFEVIRNTTVYEGAPATPPSAEPVVVYAGAVNTGRGLELLIEAMPEIPARLEICGDGDLLPLLRQTVAARGLQEKVTFTGYLDPSELRKRIESASVGYLMLAFQGLSYYHSLANKFFDYMHAGLPQVCIDFPEYRYINEHSEVALLCPMEKGAVLHAIQTLLQDNLLRIYMRNKALEAAKHYNWQQESQKLLAFYSGLFAHKAG